MGRRVGHGGELPMLEWLKRKGKNWFPTPRVLMFEDPYPSGVQGRIIILYRRGCEQKTLWKFYYMTGEQGRLWKCGGDTLCVNEREAGNRNGRR